jgi:hypothetical protein
VISTILVLLTCMTTWYSVVWLPRYFWPFGFSRAFLIVACITAVASAVVVWRRETAVSAAAAGFGIHGGLIGLFWPALEVAFQHIDGGAMSAYGNVVFVTGVLSSIAALVGGSIQLTQGRSALNWLLAATSGTLLVGLIAPDSPPSDREVLVLGLPLLASGTIASWFARRSEMARRTLWCFVGCVLGGSIAAGAAQSTFALSLLTVPAQSLPIWCGLKPPDATPSPRLLRCGQHLHPVTEVAARGATP